MRIFPATSTAALCAALVLGLPTVVRAQADDEPFVVIEVIEDTAYERDDMIDQRLDELTAQAQPCGLDLWWDFAGKFAGLDGENGTLVVVDGYLNMSDDLAQTVLDATKLCFPKAYVLRLRYAGE